MLYPRLIVFVVYGLFCALLSWLCVFLLFVSVLSCFGSVVIGAFLFFVGCWAGGRLVFSVIGFCGFFLVLFCCYWSVRFCIRLWGLFLCFWVFFCLCAVWVLFFLGFLFLCCFCFFFRCRSCGVGCRAFCVFVGFCLFVCFSCVAVFCWLCFCVFVLFIVVG